MIQTGSGEAKTARDGATCLKLAREAWAEDRAYRACCQAATPASVLGFAVPEATQALGSLTGRRAATARR